MAISITDTNTGIKEVAEAATGVERAYDYDEMPEAVNNDDTPAVVVYFESMDQDPTGETHASTFTGGINQRNWVFHIDILASQRNHLPENNKIMAVMADNMVNALETQERLPFMSVPGAQAFRFTAFRTGITLGGVEFYGIRFIITIRSF